MLRILIVPLLFLFTFYIRITNNKELYPEIAKGWLAALGYNQLNMYGRQENNCGLVILNHQTYLDNLILILLNINNLRAINEVKQKYNNIIIVDENGNINDKELDEYQIIFINYNITRNIFIFIYKLIFIQQTINIHISPKIKKDNNEKLIDYVDRMKLKLVELLSKDRIN